MGTENEVWIDDRYGVRDFAKILGAQLRETYENSAQAASFTRAARDRSLTIAVNAPWGKGKSFFLDRFAKELNENHPVIFFDAWKTDFAGAPLAAFCFEISDQISKMAGFDGNAIASVRKASGDLVVHYLKNIGTSLVSAGVGAVIPGAGIAVEAIRKGVEASSGSLPEESEDSFNKLQGEYKATKSAIEGMRVALGGLVESVTKAGKKNLPIVVVIDELDRCRPIYAIELLECVKHIFEVEGVYFVFGTNLDSLADSVKAVYGNEFNGRGYLERFFSLEIGLPSLSNINFVEQVICGAFPGGEYIEGRLIHFVSGRANLWDFADLLSKIAEYYELTPRDINSVGTKLAMILIKGYEFHALPLFCLLCFWQRNKEGASKLFPEFSRAEIRHKIFPDNRLPSMPKLNYGVNQDIGLNSAFELYYLVMKNAGKPKENRISAGRDADAYDSVHRMIYGGARGGSKEVLELFERLGNYPSLILSIGN